MFAEITEEDEEKEEETETGESNAEQATDPPAEGDNSDCSATEAPQRPLDLPYGTNSWETHLMADNCCVFIRVLPPSPPPFVIW